MDAIYEIRLAELAEARRGGQHFEPSSENPQVTAGPANDVYEWTFCSIFRIVYPPSIKIWVVQKPHTNSAGTEHAAAHAEISNA